MIHDKSATSLKKLIDNKSTDARAKIIKKKNLEYMVLRTGIKGTGRVLARILINRPGWSDISSKTMIALLSVIGKTHGMKTIIDVEDNHHDIPEDIQF